MQADGEHSPTLFRIFCCMLLASASSCATKAPPTRAEIHAQSGTLAKLAPTNAWKGAARTGPIADNWLATFAMPNSMPWSLKR